MNEPEPRRPVHRRLLRSRDDRVFAGVAGGLARHFDVDPVIFRVGFVAATLLGGLGIFAYLALYVALPEDDGSGTPAPTERRAGFVAAVIVLGIAALFVFDGEPWGWWWGPGLLVWILIALGVGYVARSLLRERWEGRGAAPEQGPAGTEAAAAPPAGGRRDSLGRVLGVIALATLAVAGAIAVAAASAWAGAEGLGEPVAAAVVVIGVALVAAAFAGGARWLVVPALVIAAPLGAVAAADFKLEGGYGERDYRPLTFAALPEEGYRLAVGEITADLRGLAWRRGEVVDLPLQLGIGAAHVVVPDEVCVDARAHADVGAIDVRGTEIGGIDVDHDDAPPPGAAPRLRLGGEVEIGLIEVLDETEYLARGGDFDDERGFGPPFARDHEDDEEEQAAAVAACEPQRQASSGGQRRRR